MWFLHLLQAPYPAPDLTDINYLTSLFDSFMAFLPRLVVALIIFLIGLYFARFTSKLVRRAMEARQLKLQVIQMLVRITYWAIVILVTTMALQTIGFNLTAFLAGLGILGFTVGFALQDVSKNFIAGILMLLSQPFELGDMIEVAGYTGSVQAIELRATELKTLDGKQVLIPNADVFSKPITNFTRNRLRRLDVSVGIAYGSDLDKTRTVTLSAIQALPGVLPDPAPVVVFNQFADSSINFTLFYWIDQVDSSFTEMVDAGFLAIERALKEAGIEIPFPVRTVYMHEQAARTA